MRLHEAPSFTVTGLDFSGSIPIREEGGAKQVYILLFTCAVTRSVHLEALTDMSAAKLILAIRRFIARRGMPSMLVTMLNPSKPQIDI